MSRMLGGMRERGPDATRTVHCGQLTIGFNRLAIVGDPRDADAVQPLAANSLLCAMNGEIYNYRNLWDSLPESTRVAAGLASDSAVLAPLAAGHPTRFLDELDGIFAGIVFDSAANSLSLFRDHVGVKPMFYARLHHGVAFASTVIGIRAVVRPQVDSSVMRAYLESGYVSTNKTLVKGVLAVPPGSSVSFESPTANARKNAWFRPEAVTGGDDIHAVVEHAVESEVPDGWPAVSTLSGGVDSTLITLLLRRAGADPTAITVRYPDVAEDADLRAARRVAADYGIKHIEVPVSADDYLREVLDSWRFDQPLSDHNAIAFNRLCAQTRELGSRVLLTGDGADELFGGYSYYQGPAKGGIRGRAAAWSFTSMASAQDRQFLWRVTGRPRLRRLRPSLTEPLRQVQEYDMLRWLEPNLLAKADRFGMAEQVEVRVPFLRPRVVAAALNLPSHRKVVGSATKVALKEAFRDTLPQYVLERPKQSFSCPIGLWFRGAAGHELRAAATWAVAGAWDIEEEQRLWQEHLDGRRDWCTQLWRLAVVRAWWRSIREPSQGAFSVATG